MRVLLATWEGGGNVPPELTIARKLIARSHKVRVLGDPTIERAARAAGCEFSPWTTAPHRTDLRPESDPLHDWDFKNPLALFKHAMDVMVCGPVARYAADTLAVLDANPSDVVLTEWILFGPALAAESRRIPCASLVPNIYMRPSPGVPPIGPGFMPATGVLGRLRDLGFGMISNRLWKSGLPVVNEARVKLGLSPATGLFEQADALDAVFVLTSKEFDFVSDALPQNVRYVGPQLDDPQWVDPWTPPWPATDQRPLVLVSLSSTFQNQADILRRCLEALASLPVRALITVGPAMNPADFPSPGPHVVVVRSAPHTTVLTQASAVIAHCGHGTVMKALAAGVPIVGIPMGRDQNDTAARIVARQAGVRLPTSAAADAIRDGITRVLNDPALRAGAKRLAAAIQRELETIDVAQEIEALVTEQDRRRRRPS